LIAPCSRPTLAPNQPPHTFSAAASAHLLPPYRHVRASVSAQCCRGTRRSETNDLHVRLLLKQYTTSVKLCSTHCKDVVMSQSAAVASCSSSSPRRKSQSCSSTSSLEVNEEGSPSHKRRERISRPSSTVRRSNDNVNRRLEAARLAVAARQAFERHQRPADSVCFGGTTFFVVSEDSVNQPTTLHKYG